MKTAREPNRLAGQDALDWVFDTVPLLADTRLKESSREGWARHTQLGREALKEAAVEASGLKFPVKEDDGDGENGKYHKQEQRCEVERSRDSHNGWRGGVASPGKVVLTFTVWAIFGRVVFRRLVGHKGIHGRVGGKKETACTRKRYES